MAAALAKDYVLTKIDQDEMVHGKELAILLRHGVGGGIPWMAILDGEGKELVTSDGPKGNVGCPVQPEEVSWFMTMIQKTRKHMTDADVTLVHDSLQAFADEILNARKQH